MVRSPADLLFNASARQCDPMTPTRPFLRLWRAVLVAGVEDAVFSRDWLRTEDFRIVCEYAGVDPVWAYEAALAFIFHGAHECR